MERSKHIAFVIASSGYGGYEIRYFKLAYYLFRKGYNVSVLVNSNLIRRKRKKAVEIILSDKDFAKRVHEIGYPYLLYGQKPLYLIASIFLNYDAFLYLCTPVLNKINADIVYTNKQIDALGVLRDKLNITIAKDFTSPDAVNSFIQNEDYKQLDLADALLFVSKSVEERFYNSLEMINYDGSHPKTFTAPIPFFFPIEQSEPFPFSEKDNLMIFAHRLLERKNPVLFANLVKKMCKDDFFKEWKFGLFGKGEKEDEVNLILKEEIKLGRVITGYKSNLTDYLNRSKIFFSLIEPDNYPSQSLAEAMYNKNAIVVLNSGNSSFYVENNGILVQKNVDKIISNLKYLIDNNLYLSCENSKKVISQKLRLEDYVEYINDLIRCLK